MRKLVGHVATKKIAPIIAISIAALALLASVAHAQGPEGDKGLPAEIALLRGEIALLRDEVAALRTIVDETVVAFPDSAVCCTDTRQLIFDNTENAAVQFVTFNLTNTGGCDLAVSGRVGGQRVFVGLRRDNAHKKGRVGIFVAVHARLEIKCLPSDDRADTCGYLVSDVRP